MALKLEGCAGDLRARATREGHAELVERARELEDYAAAIRTDGCGCGRPGCRLSRVGALASA
jgi:hypothetical protein